MADLPSIGFIGLGAMGNPMSGHLVAGGCQVSGFDIDAGNMAKAVGRGVTQATSASEVGSNAEIVQLCLPSMAVVELTIDALLTTLQPGSIIVDHSTISPDLAESLETKCAAKQITFLDAPLSGATQGAEAGTLAVMVGGDEAAYQRCLPLFEIIGDHVFHLGAVGNGQCMKLCQNLILVSTLTGLLESRQLAESVGVDTAKFLDVMDACLAPKGVLAITRPKLVDGTIDNTINGIEMITKDITLVRKLAE
ncbi:MAG: hypothetical protein DRQ60_05615, partial [Gammaproteobacteria bacterium]